MKKTIFAIAFIALSFIAMAQDKPKTKADSTITKKDTLVQLILTQEEYQALEVTIDQNIDSKTVTSNLIKFLRSKAKAVIGMTPTPPVAKKEEKMEDKPKN